MAKKKKTQPLYSESELKHYKHIENKQELTDKILEEINAEREYDDFFNNYRQAFLLLVLQENSSQNLQ